MGNMKIVEVCYYTWIFIVIFDLFTLFFLSLYYTINITKFDHAYENKRSIIKNSQAMKQSHNLLSTAFP